MVTHIKFLILPKNKNNNIIGLDLFDVRKFRIHFLIFQSIFNVIFYVLI